jgi:hypothetical protein
MLDQTPVRLGRCWARRFWWVSPRAIPPANGRGRRAARWPPIRMARTGVLEGRLEGGGREGKAGRGFAVVEAGLASPTR